MRHHVHHICRYPDEATYQRTRDHDLEVVWDTSTGHLGAQRLCGRYKRTNTTPEGQRTCDSYLLVRVVNALA